MIRSKNKNIAAVRLHKVVSEFVDKYLVACVDCASSNDFTTVVNATRQNVEVMAQGVGRRVHQKVLPLADQSRKGKKEEDLFWDNLRNLIILA